MDAATRPSPVSIYEDEEDEGRLIGLVLAAGAGRRLQPLTDDLPKTLLPVDGERTILDIALANLEARRPRRDRRRHAASPRTASTSARQALERDHGVTLELVFNEKAEEWNNAYSLWVARERLREGAILVNGDTVHPASVEQTVLAARGPDIVLAADTEKALGEEEMKLHVTDDGFMDRINKALDPRPRAASTSA